MSETDKEDINSKFKTFVLPYQIGVYLAVNAVSDAAILNDGPNCTMPKAEYIYGNHDINSTLFSADGLHRIFYTMSHPLKQKGKPETKLEAMMSVLADSGKYGIVITTGLPFQALSGMDYEGIASSVQGKAPIVSVPPKSLESDWLDGYALTLEAIASALPFSTLNKKKKNSVAIAGYFFDRNEGDCLANISEMKRLLAECGLDLISVFPGGKPFESLKSATEAEYVVSMPYGRNAAASIAKKSGAKLIETDIPIGFKGTAAWIRTICDAAGIDIPQKIREEEKSARQQYLRCASLLRHKPVAFAGDPYLFEAICMFCKELLMRPDIAFIDCSPRKLSYIPDILLYQPVTEQAVNAVAALKGYKKPAVLIGNSFSNTEKYVPDTPFLELGFPSYSHHCLIEEPFMGYKGALSLIGRLINSQMQT